MPKVEDGHIVETPTEARAGVTGMGGRQVLAWSTIAAAVLMVAVFLWFFW